MSHNLWYNYRGQVRGVRPDHLSSHQHSHAVPSIFDILCKLAVEFGIPYVRLPREAFYFSPHVSRRLRMWYAINLAKFFVLRGLSVVNAHIACRYGVHTNDWFVGVLYTGHMDALSVCRGLTALTGNRRGGFAAEVLLHPGSRAGTSDDRLLDARVRDYSLAPERSRELAALKSPSLLRAIKEDSWELTCYGCLAVSGARPHEHGTNVDTAATPVRRPPAGATLPTLPREAPKGELVKPPLRTLVIIDETPFYHPEYLRRLISECADIDLVAAAIVHAPGGGILQKYLLRRWRDIGIRQVAKLGIRRLGLQMSGRLPRVLRGDHEGSVEAVARRFSIPYRRVSRVNNAEFLSYVESLSPDLILSSNSLIFGDRLIRSARVACINRHSALLPSLGGLLPVFRAIQFGMKYTGASVHYMTREIDRGAVLARRWVPIFPGDTLQGLYKLCFHVSYEATAEAVEKLRMGGEAEGLPANGLDPSYYSYPNDADWKEFRAKGGRFA